EVGEESPAHVRDASEPALGDDLPCVFDGRGVAVVEADGGDDLGGVGGTDYGFGLFGGPSDGFLDPQRFARPGDGGADLLVQEVRCADGDDVDVRVVEDVVVVTRRVLVAEHVLGEPGTLFVGVGRDHQARSD